jgi:hypothetical protein
MVTILHFAVPRPQQLGGTGMAKSRGILSKIGKEAGKVAGGVAKVASGAVETVAEVAGSAAGTVVEKGREVVPGMKAAPRRRRSTSTGTSRSKPKSTAKKPATKASAPKASARQEDQREAVEHGQVEQHRHQANPPQRRTLTCSVPTRGALPPREGSV